jgi:MFS family permease
MLANIMQGLDTTIANVALPHIRGSLSASLDQISWVLTSYIGSLPVIAAHPDLAWYPHKVRADGSRATTAGQATYCGGAQSEQGTSF